MSINFTKNHINKVFSYIKNITKSWLPKKTTKQTKDQTTITEIQQSKPITITIKVTLEEIYNKNDKIVFIPIMKQCHSCTQMSKENCRICFGKIFYCDTLTLSIPVYKQSKLIYSNKGHEVDFYKPGNIIILIKQLKHSIYKRKSKYDLFTSIQINPLEICRKQYLYLPLLSGKHLKIQLTHDCFQFHMKKIKGYGLFNENENNYGDLYIHFVIVIPPISQNILTQLSKKVPQTCKYTKKQTNIEELSDKIHNVPILYNDHK